MPRQHVENTKEFWSENEAKRANKHANKRIIYWPPFWNKVYVLLAHWQEILFGSYEDRGEDKVLVNETIGNHLLQNDCAQYHILSVSAMGNCSLTLFDDRVISY